jgi:predicted ATPase
MPRALVSELVDAFLLTMSPPARRREFLEHMFASMSQTCNDWLFIGGGIGSGKSMFASSKLACYTLVVSEALR